MSHVFIVDTNKQPLSPVHPGQARLLLKAGKASVYRYAPFTLILKRAVGEPRPVPLRLKIDPGARTTGLALVDDAGGEVIWAAELTHRGAAIKHALDKRRAIRRGRRSRQTRYRAPRFDNRRRQAGWLPPSLLSRVHNILNWVKRITKIAHVTALSQEIVRFDLQKLEQSGITGIMYQQGTHDGYEIREFLLEKWGRTCCYCEKKDVPLQIEHIVPRAHGGTDRISNLCLACEPCNMKKGTQDIRAFLKEQPEQLARLLVQAKASLKDATAVNATRWYLFERLKETNLPLEVGSGGRTKYNRRVRGLPKTHWLDAVCVGASTPEQLSTERVIPLLITANGHGRRKMCNTNDLGFPIGHRKRHRRYFGFQTGDQVQAVVPEGFAAVGTHVGRVMVRATGNFDITTHMGRITSIPHRFCHPRGRNDGYSYQRGVRHAATPLSYPPDK